MSIDVLSFPSRGAGILFGNRPFLRPRPRIPLLWYGFAVFCNRRWSLCWPHITHVAALSGTSSASGTSLYGQVRFPIAGCCQASFYRGLWILPVASFHFQPGTRVLSSIADALSRRFFSSIHLIRLQCDPVIFQIGRPEVGYVVPFGTTGSLEQRPARCELFVRWSTA
ncbi:hypothetical protein CALCODRAFT_496677 [Calocera cornea HHB12733]|uniref:Uncharacterized protein n=1 Tax=Calocera cornea HHB12733 TaxID=1353952 RepID=A0A165FPB5_9BASI|nr:hypothetical protein CALCODRAFT_496677 [Calocera cornea HHB12733]